MTIPCRNLAAAAITILFSALAAPTRAGISEQVPVGPRAIAMGGAFSSLADDATALFWNPAGLPWIEQQEITGTHANLFGSGIKDDYLAFVLPLTPSHAVAVDWYHSGFEDPELKFGENRIDVAYGWRFGSLFSVGGGAKYLTRGTDLDGSTVRSGSGLGLDLGGIASPYRGLRLGLMVQDLFNTSIRYDQGGTVVAFLRNVRLAASYALHHDAVVAIDIDDRWHVGAEWRPLEIVALRAGFEDDRKGSEGVTYTAGAGFKASLFRVDYARVMPPTLGATDHFSLSMGFNFNPSKVRIEKVETRPIYSSLYKSYESDSFATVQIRNLDDRAIDARVSVTAPDLLDIVWERDVPLRPKSVTAVPVAAPVSKRALARSGDGQVPMEVSASYRSRTQRTEKYTDHLYAYGPGAINWGEGVEQAAAFVTSSDPVVEAVARDSSIVAVSNQDPFGNRNLSFTAALFDALAVLGVAYVSDPNNPFATISETRDAVDTIKYPYQTLAGRTGDCDDTTVLMAALVGNVGINTQFVDAPGHIFLLVDTGLHERNRIGLAVDSSRYVVNSGGVWIPLETTAIDRGFAEAWRIGAESYSSYAASGQVQVVNVLTAQARYKPGEPQVAGQAPRISGAALRDRVARDAREVEGWREAYLDGRYPDMRQVEAPSPTALNELAHIDYLAGEFAGARAKLQRILDGDSGSARAHNNLAVAWAGEGDIEQARPHLEAAFAAAPEDPGLWLNLGLLQYAAGDTSAAWEPIAQGILLSGGYERACSLLGVSSDDVRAREGAKKMTAGEVRRLLKIALDRIPKRAYGPAPVSGKPAAAPPPPKVRIVPGGVRSDWVGQLRQVLYWKD
jgi:tetratricopeptide repeat protein